MPGFTTHYILGMKAYNDLSNNSLKYIISKYRWLYQLGLQGPDIFFYYIPVLRHRDYRNVGSYMHEHHIRDFFSNYLRGLAKINSRQQREEGLAYFWPMYAIAPGPEGVPVFLLPYDGGVTLERGAEQKP